MFAALVATAFAGACTGEGGETGWTVSVDTVGGTVRVVNTAPSTGAEPTIVADEEFRIGTVEGGGATSFGLIRSVAVLPDGRFAVADGQAEEVRLFDREGHHLRTFGGEGAGPGELRGMQGVYVDHEALLRVAEQGNARLSIFHPDRGFLRSFPLRISSYGFRGPWRAAIDSAGRTLVASAGQFGEGRFWNMLRIYDPSMTQLDSIPYYDYTDDVQRSEVPGAWRITLGTGSWTWAQVPFYAQPRETLAPTGEFWSSREGSPQLEVARWSPAGDTSLVLFSRRAPDPVMPAERDSAMAELRAGLAQRGSASPKLEASRVPATKPPLYGLSLDDRGRLWARLTDPIADTTAYDVFMKDGSYAETVFFPFRIDRWIPPVVRGDTVWAVVTDEVDVQYVVRARCAQLPIRTSDKGPTRWLDPRGVAKPIPNRRWHCSTPEPSNKRLLLTSTKLLQIWGSASGLCTVWRGSRIAYPLERAGCYGALRVGLHGPTGVLTRFVRFREKN